MAYIVCMGVVPGPEKTYDTCRKTMHTGTMVRGLTVILYVGTNFTWIYLF
jgi:hypothetical protein